LRFFFAVSTSDITDFRTVKTTPTIKRLWQAIAVLVIAGTFISLGLWQLHRAQDLQREISSSKTVVQDERIYELSDFTSPQGSLPVAAYGKSVTVTGHYIADFKAPNQKGADGKVGDWHVSLMQVDTDSAILVVRGLWSQATASPEIVMATKVTATGRIYPHQIEDHAQSTPSQLSRIDSSVLTSTTGDQLYDGFISATSEETRGGAVSRDRISIAAPTNPTATPGYYWQHISYVVIWWFMAALVLWAPFYKRREEQ
jgi:cytochrome oxidase assembly protein ShyY1